MASAFLDKKMVSAFLWNAFTGRCSPLWLLLQLECAVGNPCLSHGHKLTQKVACIAIRHGQTQQGNTSTCAFCLQWTIAAHPTLYLQFFMLNSVVGTGVGRFGGRLVTRTTTMKRDERGQKDCHANMLSLIKKQQRTRVIHMLDHSIMHQKSFY